MADTRNSRHRRAVRLVAALVPIALLTGPSPAHAKWLSKPGATVAGGVVAGGVASSLRKNLDELPDRLRGALDAFSRDDAGGIEGTFEDLARLPGRIGMDASPVLSGARGAGKKFKKRLVSAKRSIGRFVGRAGETVTDIRAALAIDRDERQWYESEARVLDKAPLPSVKLPRTRRAPESSPGSLGHGCRDDSPQPRSRHAGPQAGPMGTGRRTGVGQSARRPCCPCSDEGGRLE